MNGRSTCAQFLDVVNGEAIIGANIFRDMFSSVRDVAGGRAGCYERALSGARDAALEDMMEAARQFGADEPRPRWCELERRVPVSNEE